jgi:3-oxoacyl-[acyl-carrier-protein] synthase-3
VSVIYSRILGTGGYLPEKVLTNKELERLVDTTEAWIWERTGIRERHVVSDGETCVDLAEAARGAPLRPPALRRPRSI